MNLVIILNTLKFLHKVSVGVNKNSSVAVQNWSVRWRGCSFLRFYNVSYHEDVKFVLWDSQLVHCTSQHCF